MVGLLYPWMKNVKILIYSALESTEENSGSKQNNRKKQVNIFFIADSGILLWIFLRADRLEGVLPRRIFYDFYREKIIF